MTNAILTKIWPNKEAQTNKCCNSPKMGMRVNFVWFTGQKCRVCRIAISSLGLNFLHTEVRFLRHLRTNQLIKSGTVVEESARILKACAVFNCTKYYKASEIICMLCLRRPLGKILTYCYKETSVNFSLYREMCNYLGATSCRCPLKTVCIWSRQEFWCIASEAHNELYLVPLWASS